MRFGFALVLAVLLPLHAGHAQTDPMRRDNAAPPAAQETAELPTILRDLSSLPEPVRAMRDKILAAAMSGDTEKLRGVLQSGPSLPALSFTDQGDPIEAMKADSNDGGGLEIMAILTEVMEAGFLHIDQGTPDEVYVWPYFTRYPLNRLTPSQTVELFRIVTAYEFKEMQDFGAYNFYRVGIAPDGTWRFFLNGD